jgi:HemY protein
VIRATLAIILFAALVAVAVFFADHPGHVEVVWQDWQIETSVGVFVAAAILAVMLVSSLLWLVLLIVGSPSAFLRRRRDRRRRAGYRALTQGMVAVAAGDPQEARRCARRADALLADPPLTLLLSAQAAQLEGDEMAAKNFFTAMIERPEMEFLGTRGLLNQALRAGDLAAALRLTERAATLRPNTPWVAEGLFDLQVREGRWEAAQETLKHAAKRRIIARERARHYRGVILYELSRDALANGDRRLGARSAAEAQALTPDLAGPAAHHARILLEDQRTGPAAKAIERAWRTAPQPELAQVYRAIYCDETPLARVKCFERLAAQNPEARESFVILAEAAFEGQLWGEARRYLDKGLSAPAPRFARPANAGSVKNDDTAGPSGATPRLCLLMARLADAEGRAGEGMREWLDRAVTAMPDPRYICAKCGGESLEWRSLCPHCGSFDTLAWRTPARATAATELPITPAAGSSDSREVLLGQVVDA